MPYSKVRNHPDCGSGQIAVVKKGEGTKGRRFGCHDSEASADKQIAAIHAREGAQVTEVLVQETLGGDPSPGTKKDKRLRKNQQAGEVTEELAEEGQPAGTEEFAQPDADGNCPPGFRKLGDNCVPDDGATTDATGFVTEAPAEPDGSTWQGVLVVEGKVTGDGREFASGSLKWPDPAETMIPLRWNKEESHGGEQRTTAVNVGRITSIERDGALIRGRGQFDLGGADGTEAARLVRSEFLRGVSVDIDDIGQSDIELVWPDDADGDNAEEEDGLVKLLFAAPEKTIFKKARIRGATLTNLPAFVEAYVELVTGDEGAAAALAPGGAVTAHEVATSDAPPNVAVWEGRLQTRVTQDVAHAMYAWVDPRVTDATLTRTSCRFPHHEVDEAGEVGPANLTVCASSIALLDRAEHGLSDTERRGVYAHLAAHLQAAGLEAPPLESEALVAHAGTTWRPPAEWFIDPRLSVATAITVTEAGRVYGHAAQWGQCHLGPQLAGLTDCVTPPFEEGHPYFLTGEVLCDSGARVAVGQITVGTGHAPMYLGASTAHDHYDNTGAAVADVVVGNDRYGIWVAGAIRPEAEERRVRELRGAGQVSGDWRRIGGQLRLVGLLAVNVPGFPVPPARARVDGGRAFALVAAGRLAVAPGNVAYDAHDAARALRRAADLIAQQIGRPTPRDEPIDRDALVARVHGGR